VCGSNDVTINVFVAERLNVPLSHDTAMFASLTFKEMPSFEWEIPVANKGSCLISWTNYEKCIAEFINEEAENR
jgi:hypothetical protein